MKIFEVTEWYDPEKEFIDSAMPPIQMVRYDEVKPMIEALKFYGDEENWEAVPSSSHPESTMIDIFRETDGGSTAREALKRLEEG